MISPEYSWQKYNLADLYDFTPEDLEANRRGVMSERQKQREHETYLMSRGCRLIFVVFAIIAVPLFAIATYTSLPNSMWILITPFMLIIVGLALFHIWPHLRAIPKSLTPPPPIEQVNSVTGAIDVDQAVRIYINRKSTPPMYLLAIRDLKFPVAGRKLYLFDKTKTYKVYFIRTKVYSTSRHSDYPSFRILSIEEIPAEQI